MPDRRLLPLTSAAAALGAGTRTAMAQNAPGPMPGPRVLPGVRGRAGKLAPAVSGEPFPDTVEGLKQYL